MCTARTWTQSMHECPIFAVPFPCVVNHRGSADAAGEQYHPLTGAIVRHCMNCPRHWAKVLLLSPEKSGHDVLLLHFHDRSLLEWYMLFTDCATVSIRRRPQDGSC